MIEQQAEVLFSAEDIEKQGDFSLAIYFSFYHL